MMSQTIWFFPIIVFYAMISSYGLYLLKSAHSIYSLGYIIGFVIYGTGFIIWLYILKSYPLSTAFPTAAGAMIVATQIIGIIFLKETLHFPTIIGSLFILFGIILISTTMVKS